MDEVKLIKKMPICRLPFDIRGRLIVRCKTLDQAIAFCKFFSKNEESSEMLVRVWESYGENTCYRIVERSHKRPYIDGWNSYTRFLLTGQSVKDYNDLFDLEHAAIHEVDEDEFFDILAG